MEVNEVINYLKDDSEDDIDIVTEMKNDNINIQIMDENNIDSLIDSILNEGLSETEMNDEINDNNNEKINDKLISCLVD